MSMHGSMRKHVPTFQSKATKIAIHTALPGEIADLPAEYTEFADVFAKTEFNKLPERKPWVFRSDGLTTIVRQPGLQVL